MRKRRCVQCEGSFRVIGNVIQKYCSRECYWESRRWKLNIECVGCGNIFEIHPFRKKNKNFCSRDCFNDWAKINYSGEGNPNFRSIPWNKGLTKDKDHKVLELAKKLSEIKNKKDLTGKNNPFYGKKHSKETIIKIRKARARQNFSFYNSSIEIKIQRYLKRLGIEFFTHFCINDIEHAYNCDIFIPSMNLVIECDGNYFHGNPSMFSEDELNRKQKEQVIRDNFRNQEMEKKGYNLLRLWEEEIVNMSLKDFYNRVFEAQQHGRMSK